MSAAELAGRLRAKGVELWVDGTRLRYRARSGALDPSDVEQLAHYKPELIALLTASPQASAEPEDRTLPITGAEFGRVVRRTAQASLDPYLRHVAPFRGFVLNRLGIDKTFVRGGGCYLYDEQGRRYADFIAQYGAVPFGHDPAPIWAAVDATRAGGEPNLAAMSVLPAAGELAEALLAIVPRGLEHVILANSGAEAVEVALKLARSSTRRRGILSTRDAFHGLTLGGLSATGRPFYRKDFGAPVPGFDFVPFGDLRALEQVLTGSPDFYAALVVEPIQGEGGIHVAPPGYLAQAHALCRSHGVLLIVDEVQTGLGRTGDMFACEYEDVHPDVLVVAKALGGGIMPIGACVSTAAAYPDVFDLRHSSTFAGNALACRVGLAAVDMLTGDGGRLIGDVKRRGARLFAGLASLQGEFGDVIADVRGRGLMLGVELDLDGLVRRQCGLLACLHEAGMLLQLVTSYLLNVEQIRIAGAVGGECVLRVQPPLVVDDAMCDDLVAALRRLCTILRVGDAYHLLGHLVGASESGATALVDAPRRRPHPGRTARFAFVVHLLVRADIRYADDSLGAFTDEELDDLVGRVAEFGEPIPVGQLVVGGDGAAAFGELIMVPVTAAELLAMTGRDAVDLVQRSVDLAARRGAKVVGLGGFTSIVADGGLAVRAPEGVAVTSGNSLTAWAAVAAVEQFCRDNDRDLRSSRVAIVGATGAIGHALSLACVERVGDVTLLGRPNATASAVARLASVAQDCARHVADRAAAGVAYPVGTLAARMLAADSPAQLITTAAYQAEEVRRASIVLTATNTPDVIVTADHLETDALVVDVSRPYNVDPAVTSGRPDVTVIRGGVLRAPGDAVLGALAGDADGETVVACASETIVLALSGMRSPHLCGRLDPATVNALGHAALEYGFAVSTAPEGAMAP